MNTENSRLLQQLLTIKPVYVDIDKENQITKYSNRVFDVLYKNNHNIIVVEKNPQGLIPKVYNSLKSALLARTWANL